MTGPVASGIASVAIGGDNNEPITIRVATTQTLIDDVRARYDDDFVRLGIAEYSPRPWLEALVDEFLAGPGGYFVIEAEAGMGKSLFAAAQTRRFGCPAHFPRSTEVTSRTTSVAQRNLIAQLLHHWNRPADGLLPSWASEANGLSRALSEVAKTRDETKPGAPIVVIVDGLDEFLPEDAETSVAQPVPFGLPLEGLPPGVFVIATARSGTRLGPLRKAATICDWREHTDANRADMRRYLTELVTRGAIAESLPDDFVPTLADRCGGLWLYLRFVLRQIQLGHRAPATVDRLPASLDDYFHEEFAALSERPDWDATMRPLLGALAAALEPLEHWQLAAFAEAANPREVRRILCEPLNPFLSIGDPGTRFALYHDSLRAFLETPDPGGTPFRSELAEAAIEAHRLVADHYLTSWGGLDTSLERLVGAETEPDGYGLRAVVTHLEKAERYVDVHRLLACEHGGRNVWHTVRDRRMELTGYLGDVAIGHRHAGSETARLRYRLIAASVTSQAATVPAPLVAALVEAGMWTPGQALDAAARGMDEKQVKDLLRSIANRLSPAQHPAALRLIAALPDDDPRCAALAALIPHLSAPLRAQVLETAATIAPEIERTVVLGALAKHGGETLLPAVFEAILRMESPLHRSGALLELLPRLTGPVFARALDSSRRTVAAVGFAPFRAIHIRHLAEHTEPGEAVALMREAIALTRTIEGTGRFTALAILAQFTPEPIRMEILEEVRLGPARQQVTVLRHLAGQSSGRVAAGLLDEAYQLARSLPDPDERHEALTELLPGVPEEDRAARAREAVAAAGRRTAPMSLIHQARLAENHLSGAARDGVFHEIWQRCAALDAEWEQHLVVEDWAHRFPGGPALAMIRSWRLPRFQVDGLIAVARHSPDGTRRSLLREAYSLATTIGDEGEQALVYAALLGGLSEKARAAAVTALLDTATRSPEAFGTALTHLPENGDLVERALGRVESAGGYVTLAALLSAERFGALLDGVAGLPDPWQRLDALLGAAPFVPPNDVDRYLEICRDLGREGIWAVGAVSLLGIRAVGDGSLTISPHGVHAGPLAAVLTHPALGPDRAREVRAEVGAAIRELTLRLRSPGNGGYRLLRTDLAQAVQLAVAGLDGDKAAEVTVLWAAEVMSFRWTLAQALTVLVPALDEPEQTIADALRLFQSVPPGWDQDSRVRSDLGTLIPHLSATDRDVTIRDWLTAVAGMSSVQQGDGVRTIAPHLPETLLPTAARIAATIHDHNQGIEARERAHALAALAEVWRGDPAPLREAMAALPDDAGRGHVLAASMRSGACVPIGEWPVRADRATLLELIAARGPDESADELFHTVRDVVRWWP